jgi:hypothetical protein
MSTAHSEASTKIQQPRSPDGLAGELLARRRKRMPMLTLALIVLAAAAAAFIGGIEAQKHWGKSSTSSSGIPSSLAAAFSSGGFPGGASNRSGAGGFPGGFGGANATTGTVTLIKGTTIYVTNAAGNTVLVKTSARSRVSKSVAGSVKTIHPGDSVTVTGSQNKDGSISARQVTIGGGSG